MLNRVKGVLFSTIAACAVFIAGTGISPYSWHILYEPDVPEVLKK